MVENVNVTLDKKFYNFTINDSLIKCHFQSDDKTEELCVENWEIDAKSWTCKKNVGKQSVSFIPFFGDRKLDVLVHRTRT